jgi:hypothetical protein
MFGANEVREWINQTSVSTVIAYSQRPGVYPALQSPAAIEWLLRAWELLEDFAHERIRK